jgi:two-component system CheB/CheR fusion protein
MLVRTYAIEVNRVTLQIERVTEVMISPDRAIPIGLILNELISNALKHGLQDQAGTISVRLEMRSPDIVQLAVVNTGRQLPQGFDPIAVSSLGFQLINSLVRQIDGELLLDRNPLTQFRITFDRVG